MQFRKHRIGITLGDPHGIGPEVVIKALQDNNILEEIVPVIYGSRRVLSYYHKALKIKPVDYKVVKDGQVLSDGIVHLVELTTKIRNIQPGIATPEAGDYALDGILSVVEGLMKGHIDGLVTGPINKTTVYRTSFPYQGHTSYLSQKFDATNATLMTMICEGLRIGVATDHVAIKTVAKLITKDLLLAKCESFIQTLVSDFGIPTPKLALLGMNPHAGEQGLIGTEEKMIFSPLVAKMQRQGISVQGPFSSDGFFGSSAYLQYDGVLAMYHDQGLIPFKVLAFDSGVNYTAGLSIVRTSPDHGVAYNIAGKNKACAKAMYNAIHLASTIISNRMKQK